MRLPSAGSLMKMEDRTEAYQHLRIDLEVI